MLLINNSNRRTALYYLLAVGRRYSSLIFMLTAVFVFGHCRAYHITVQYSYRINVNNIQISVSRSFDRD